MCSSPFSPPLILPLLLFSSLSSLPRLLPFLLEATTQPVISERVKTRPVRFCSGLWGVQKSHYIRVTEQLFEALVLGLPGEEGCVCVSVCVCVCMCVCVCVCGMEEMILLPVVLVHYLFFSFFLPIIFNSLCLYLVVSVRPLMCIVTNSVSV